jgi:hypothetical protein
VLGGEDAFDNVQFEKGGEAVQQWAAEACGITADEGEPGSDEG